MGDKLDDLLLDLEAASFRFKALNQTIPIPGASPERTTSQGGDESYENLKDRVAQLYWSVA